MIKVFFGVAVGMTSYRSPIASIVVSVFGRPQPKGTNQNEGNTMKYQDIDHHNGMIVIPALALTKEVSVSAMGMYVFITAHAENIAFDDQRMDAVFTPLYGNSIDWVQDRDALIKAGLLSEPVDLVETEEEAAERSEKSKQDLANFDEVLEEKMLEDEFNA